jgi:hypothetical protein
MSKPAKDEAELVERIASSIPAWSLLAAIRAAGWAVVPQEPNFNMESEGSVAMVKLGYFPSPGEVAEIYRAMLAAAPGVKL